MPFTAQQFFETFARYNIAVWPTQVALNALAVLAVILVFRARPSDGRWVCAILAALWAWMAVAYHFAFFAAINPAAWVFGGAFLLGAIRLAWVGCVERRLQFQPRGGLPGWSGVAFIAFSLLVYPALSWALGHRYPASPSFGLPCPTTIFTMGVLMFAKAPVPLSVYVVPMLWAAVGSTAALTLGVYQDLGLLVAGVTALRVLVETSTTPQLDAHQR
jgi:hypothetical protein